MACLGVLATYFFFLLLFLQEWGLLPSPPRTLKLMTLEMLLQFIIPYCSLVWALDLQSACNGSSQKWLEVPSWLFITQRANRHIGLKFIYYRLRAALPEIINLCKTELGNTKCL